ncbi:MAG: signal peptidase II [Clostridia bacterium]|nr:signal peptidase II [Clostridia bacterium]
MCYIFAGVFVFQKTSDETSTRKISVMLINAGAIGNLFDRIFRGYVVDMIEVTFIEYPVFNFADCCIVIGCILLCVYVAFFDKDEKNIKISEEEKDDGKDNACM